VRILKALEFAREAHKDQRRKYTLEPYVNHCINVSKKVANVNSTEDTIIAALLHDTVEDTSVSLEQITDLFGDIVSRLVYEVTDVSLKTDGNRRQRKEIDRQHLAKASPEGQTIKLADLIDNTYSIEIHDPNFARVYMREKKALLEVLILGNKELMEEANRQINGYYIGR